MVYSLATQSADKRIVLPTQTLNPSPFTDLSSAQVSPLTFNPHSVVPIGSRMTSSA